MISIEQFQEACLGSSCAFNSSELEVISSSLQISQIQ